MKMPCLLLYSFTFQMTPKTLKYVNYETQDHKHENTWKSMEFYKRDEYFCPPSVYTFFHVNFYAVCTLYARINIFS